MNVEGNVEGELDFEILSDHVNVGSPDDTIYDFRVESESLPPPPPSRSKTGLGPMLIYTFLQLIFYVAICCCILYLLSWFISWLDIDRNYLRVKKPLPPKLEQAPSPKNRDNQEELIRIRELVKNWQKNEKELSEAIISAHSPQLFFEELQAMLEFCINYSQIAQDSSGGVDRCGWPKRGPRW